MENFPHSVFRLIISSKLRANLHSISFGTERACSCNALKEAPVTATVGIGPNGQGGFALSVALAAHIALEDEQARQLVTVAHQVCPYSNAVRGNIDVQLSVNGLAL